MNPKQRVAKAMSDAQVKLSDYLEPEFRNLERTIPELLDVLDDTDVIDALEILENETAAQDIKSPSTVPAGVGQPFHSVAESKR